MPYFQWDEFESERGDQRQEEHINSKELCDAAIDSGKEAKVHSIGFLSGRLERIAVVKCIPFRIVINQ